MNTHPQHQPAHSFDSEAVLMDHELETDQETPVAPVIPIPVVVADAVTIADVIPQHISFRTIVLTADNPYAQMLPLDPLRVTAKIVSLDHDVVMSGSRDQAQDKANISDASLLRPNGAVLSFQAGFPVPVYLSNTDPVWVSGPTYPSRVSVVITRRTT